MDGWCGDVAYTWLYRGIHISIRFGQTWFWMFLDGDAKLNDPFSWFRKFGIQSTQAAKFEDCGCILQFSETSSLDPPFGLTKVEVPAQLSYPQ